LTTANRCNNGPRRKSRCRSNWSNCGSKFWIGSERHPIRVLVDPFTTLGLENKKVAPCGNRLRIDVVNNMPLDCSGVVDVGGNLRRAIEVTPLGNHSEDTALQSPRSQSFTSRDISTTGDIGNIDLF